MEKRKSIRKLLVFVMVLFMFLVTVMQHRTVFAVPPDVNDAGTISLKISEIMNVDSNFDMETGNWVAEYDVAGKMWDEMSPGLVPGDHVVCSLELVNDTEDAYDVQKDVETFSRVYKETFTEPDYEQIYGRDMKLGFDFQDASKSIGQTEIKNQPGALKINTIYAEKNVPAYVAVIPNADAPTTLQPDEKYSMKYHLYFIFESPNMSQNMMIWLKLAMLFQKQPEQPHEITIKAKKIWENNGFAGNKKDLYFCLMNRSNVVENTKIKIEGGDEVSWTVPEKDDQGNVIDYKVAEIDDEGNEWTSQNSGWTSEITGDKEKGFTVTNTYDKKNMEIPVRKEWQDYTGGKISAPVERLEVELYKDGVATGIRLELNSENSWKGEFKNLPVSASVGGETYKYTIKEVGENGDSIKLEGKEYKISYQGSMEQGYIITNKQEAFPTPSIPSEHSKPSASSVNASVSAQPSPKTGDTSNVLLYAGLLAVSGSVLFGLKRRKNKV